MPRISLSEMLIDLIPDKVTVLISNHYRGKTLKSMLDEQGIEYEDLSKTIDGVQKVSSFGDGSVKEVIQKCEPRKLYYLTEFDWSIVGTIVEKAKEGVLFVIEVEGKPYIQNEYLSGHAAIVSGWDSPDYAVPYYEFLAFES